MLRLNADLKEASLQKHLLPTESKPYSFSLSVVIVDKLLTAIALDFIKARLMPFDDGLNDFLSGNIFYLSAGKVKA